MSQDINKIAEDFIKLEFNEKILSLLKEEFYKICRKHGIKQGKKLKDGSVVTNNYEWSMCLSLFNDCLKNAVEINILISDTPEDLTQ